jgi:hypothetical protein
LKWSPSSADSLRSSRARSRSLQQDLKKGLAYSTCSQLGYMAMAVGVGSTTGGMFHLFTHAFFKACLFLGAGSVIHAVHSQLMGDMGGLRKKMPVAYWTFRISTLAIAGTPLFSGFMSKEMVLTSALAYGHMRGAQHAAVALLLRGHPTALLRDLLHVPPRVPHLLREGSMGGREGPRPREPRPRPRGRGGPRKLTRMRRTTTTTRTPPTAGTVMRRTTISAHAAHGGHGHAAHDDHAHGGHGHAPAAQAHAAHDDHGHHGNTTNLRGGWPSRSSSSRSSRSSRRASRPGLPVALVQPPLQRRSPREEHDDPIVGGDRRHEGRLFEDGRAQAGRTASAEHRLRSALHEAWEHAHHTVFKFSLFAVTLGISAAAWFFVESAAWTTCR